MDKHVADLLNQQINKELYSAYLYLSFADYYEEQGLSGFANWYFVQVQEERDHALIMRNYLHANGEHIELEAIEKPDKTFTDPLQPLEAALEHEKYVTSLINDIYAAADAVHDYRTMQFLDWFISEQGEEEENASDLVARMKLFGKDAKALYDLDQEYAARVYTQASPLANA
ncbi:MAG: ferritin [Eggerthellaceae bacterium]